MATSTPTPKPSPTCRWPSGPTSNSSMASTRSGAWDQLSLDDGVAVAMRHLPVTVFASIRLRGTQLVAPGLTVNGCRRVLQAGCVRHVAYDVVGEQFESVRRAVGEALGEPSEKLV